MRVFGLATVVVVVAACGGGGGGDGGGTQPPPAVASVIITPNNAQSTTLCGTVAFSALARDANQNTLSRTINWTSSTANVIVPNSGASVTATGVGVGSSTITASADGVPSTGVTVTVSAAAQPAQTASVDATTSNTFAPSCVVIAAGGTVTWNFAATHNVRFGTNKPAGGDIDDKSSGSDSRTFPTAGNYSYNCTLHNGMSGRVIVQ
jgi:plastocyanin